MSQPVDGHYQNKTLRMSTKLTKTKKTTMPPPCSTPQAESREKNLYALYQARESILKDLEDNTLPTPDFSDSTTFDESIFNETPTIPQQSTSITRSSIPSTAFESATDLTPNSILTEAISPIQPIFRTQSIDVSPIQPSTSRTNITVQTTQATINIQ